MKGLCGGWDLGFVGIVLGFGLLDLHLGVDK